MRRWGCCWLISLIFLSTQVEAIPLGRAQLNAASSPSTEQTNEFLTTAQQTHQSFIEDHRFFRTFVGIALTNQTIWFYDRYIRLGGNDLQFRVGWNTFVQNLKGGYQFDDNSFWANHFYHPVQGSLYFTGARANGYNYWQSAVWTLAGSWMWEQTAEANLPSTNDWINTPLGGMVFGESLFRFSNMVTDNRARGGERIMREVGGFLIAPVRGFNRVVTGEAFVVHQNPADRMPSDGWTELRVGARPLEADAPGPSATKNRFIEFRTQYGDAFDSHDSPFGYFDFDFLANFDDARNRVGKIDVTGLLAGTLRGADVALPGSGGASGSEHLFGFFQSFDYLDNDAFEFGNQNVSAGYLGRFPAQRSLTVRPSLHLNGILLGATRTDYPLSSVRTYDYGMGLGYEAAIAIAGTGGREYVTLGRSQFFMRSINGNDADHIVSLNTLKLWIPIGGFAAAGGDYVYYTADRRYEYHPDAIAWSSELRLYLSWVVN